MRDTLQGVDPAQADVEPLRARPSELVDGPSEPLGDLAFLGDGDLLTHTLIAELRLLAGLLKRLSADTDLPQGHRGADPGPAQDEEGRQTLKESGAGIVLEFVAAFAARSPVSRGQPSNVSVRQRRIQALGEHRDAQPEHGGKQRSACNAGQRPAKPASPAPVILAAS